MRAVVKVLSLIVGLVAAAVIVYRTTHPAPPPAAAEEAREKCDQTPREPACPPADFTFAPSR